MVKLDTPFYSYSRYRDVYFKNTLKFKGEKGYLYWECSDGTSGSLDDDYADMSEFDGNTEAQVLIEIAAMNGDGEDMAEIPAEERDFMAAKTRDAL